MFSISFTRFISAELTKVMCVRLRFCLVVFLVRMWLLKACLRLILPVPVSVKRFLAPDLVFIFGIVKEVRSEKTAAVGCLGPVRQRIK